MEVPTTMPNDTCPASGHKLPDMPLPVKLMSSQDLEQVTDAQYPA